MYVLGLFVTEYQVLYAYRMNTYLKTNDVHPDLPGYGIITHWEQRSDHFNILRIVFEIWLSGF